jgi:hypothetical protein
MIRAMVVAAAAAFISGCAASPSASSARGQGGTGAAAAPGGCTVDAMKICTQAQAAGTLIAPPMSMGAASTQAAMPRTARVEIPDGPTIQAMCYYDPQHKRIARADWTATAPLDEKAAAYLKSQKLCSDQ